LTGSPRRWYAADAYLKGSKEDPSGPNAGDNRAVRGGSYLDGGARAAARAGNAPGTAYVHGGFRVVPLR